MPHDGAKRRMVGCIQQGMDGLGQGLGGGLRTYPGPWARKGRELLLVCGKCQKKMRRGEDEAGLSKLKKTLKTRARRGGIDVELKLLTVPCLKVCPKGGVVACTAEMVGAGRVSILRSSDDVDALLQGIANGGPGHDSLSLSGASLNEIEEYE